ncbi:uncharacterized protein J8A68_004409 [[Candida] subhashii]|uniref:Uncharacterized protein n=1 Tax=[Candida] subhashii TaxID=561895 RepID=A0A8J5QJ32_9ASCO|nr:uncharacterized protein J8A68_004409 [[Candida] subhashii]KAG7662021.1 hypothetical protein J8A68_004409 [[Candida] subhashii]
MNESSTPSPRSKPSSEDPHNMTDEEEQENNQHGKELTPLPQLKKLLSSHSSIYNALNNPDLDTSLAIETPRLLTPDLFTQQQFSITSWQSIPSEFQNSPIYSHAALSTMKPIAKTSSILSITSDEEIITDSTVVVPSPDSVMVFETDEEEEDANEDELPANSANSANLNSFIMPKMSVSASSETTQTNNNKLFTIVVISNSYKSEIDQLIKSLHNQFNTTIKILHFNMSEVNNDEKSILEDSDLIFIINDGSTKIVEFVNSTISDPIQEIYPKITIVNLITVNYFINLFELINRLHPYQIWKASSLNQDNLLHKFTSFIELESDKVLTPKNSQQLIPRTMYSSLVSTKKPDYKIIEKQFKVDLQTSTTFNDPLKLSKSCGQIELFFTNLRNFFILDDGLGSNNNTGWIIISFTLGIGFGIGITSGAISLIGHYISNGLWGPPQDSKLLQPQVVRIDSNTVTIGNDMSTKFKLMFEKFIDQMLQTSFVLYTREFCECYLFDFSSTVIDCIRGGLEKVFYYTAIIS